MKIGLNFFTKRTNNANSPKNKVKSSTSCPGFLYTLQSRYFENVVHGVIIQYISIPIQLLLAL